MTSGFDLDAFMADISREFGLDDDLGHAQGGEAAEAGEQGAGSS